MLNWLKNSRKTSLVAWQRSNIITNVNRIGTVSISTQEIMFLIIGK